MKLIHKAVAFLVAVTLIIVYLYLFYGDSRVYTLSPERLSYFPTNDQSQGGTSTSSIDYVDGETVLSCELKESEYPWPYCGVSIHVNEDPTIGLNLSKYHTVRLNVDFINLETGSYPRMRFYLRNFNPAYSTVDNEYTHKYNGLEYLPSYEQGAIDIPIGNLQVLTWWLVDNNIPIEHSAPEYGNINKIEFATGSGAGVGNYKMVVKEVSFIGQYVEGEELFLTLLFMWIFLVVVWSGSEIRRGRRVVKQAELRQEHLTFINRSLRAQNFQFAELAHRDALTGAMNRHSIRDWFKAQIENKGPDPLELSMIYMDIDFFKKVNDTYGHKMGDDILREFAMVVMSATRKTDRLVRWGGEEFVLYCPRTSLEEATIVAENVRKTVENHIWVHGDALTCS